MPINQNNNQERKFFHMGAEQRLWETTPFKLALLGPLGLAAVLIIITALKTKGLEPCLSAPCFSEFYQLFKFQIAIASLSIPAAALVATQLRSVQTVRILEEQLQQNRFSNYIDHRELFFDIFKDLNLFNLGNSKHEAAKLYSKLYPLSKQGNFKLNTEFLMLGETIERLSLGYLEGAKLMRKDGSSLLVVHTQFFVVLSSIIDGLEEPQNPSRDDKKFHIRWATQVIDFIDDLECATNFFEESEIGQYLSNAKSYLEAGQKTLGKPNAFSAGI